MSQSIRLGNEGYRYGQPRRLRDGEFEVQASESCPPPVHWIVESKKSDLMTRIQTMEKSLPVEFEARVSP